MKWRDGEALEKARVVVNAFENKKDVWYSGGLNINRYVDAVEKYDKIAQAIALIKPGIASRLFYNCGIKKMGELVVRYHDGSKEHGDTAYQIGRDLGWQMQEPPKREKGAI